MKENDLPLNGLYKSAVMLLTMDHDSASRILKKLPKSKVQELTKAMNELGEISSEYQSSAINDFLKNVEQYSPLAATESKVKKLLDVAFGEEKTNLLSPNMTDSADNKVIESLSWMDPGQIFNLLKDEHPQIATVAISFLDPEQAANVISEFPNDKQLEITMRLASLKTLKDSAKNHVLKMLEMNLKEMNSSSETKFDGVKSTANIFNYFNKDLETSIMDNIKSKNPELAIEIEELMFIFENFLELDDRTIQTILKDVNNDELLLAIKASDDKLKDKFFNNMSKRAADLLKDDLESKGPVKLSEVKQAQKSIINIAKNLAEKGEISLGGGGGGEEMV